MSDIPATWGAFVNGELITGSRAYVQRERDEYETTCVDDPDFVHEEAFPLYYKSTETVYLVGEVSLGYSGDTVIKELKMLVPVESLPIGTKLYVRCL